MADIKEIGEIENGLQVKSNEQGQCPVCNSNNVDYGVLELEDSQMLYYPCTCQDCGATWNEWYTLSFESNDQVYSGE